MKTIGVVLVVMLVVAGVAAQGSRAQTIPATSVAFDQCQRHRERGFTRCAPLMARMAMEPNEGQVGAGGTGAAEAHEAGADVTPDPGFEHIAVNVATAAAAAAAGALVRELMNHFFGGGLPILPDAPMASTLFDPVK